MDRETAENYLDYVKALFKLEFEPLYGDYVYCDCGNFNKLSGWDNHLRCCICADIDCEWDKDKDWIIEFVHLESEDGIRVNTEHPDYDDEGMKEYLDDFIQEITTYFKFLNS